MKENNMKWMEAEEDRAKDCESAFQNGGPRVYVYGSGDDHWKQRPSSDSAAATLRLASPGEVVYARRKVGQQWLWRKRVVA
jgi:hypothetical protein